MPKSRTPPVCNSDICSIVLSANGCTHPPTQQSLKGPVGLLINAVCIWFSQYCTQRTRSCSDNPAPFQSIPVDHSIYIAANSQLNQMQVVAGGRYPGQRGKLSPYGNGTKTKTLIRPNLTSVRSLGPIRAVV